jgi:parallel beta-helix repeat protein
VILPLAGLDASAPDGATTAAPDASLSGATDGSPNVEPPDAAHFQSPDAHFHAPDAAPAQPPDAGSLQPDAAFVVPPGATVVSPPSSIQSAINSAKPGDTIVVNSGTYGESLSIGKQINLVADGTASIQGVSISADGVILQGFTIVGDYAVTLAGVSNVQILSNKITATLNGISDSGKNSKIFVSGNTILGTDPTQGNNIAFEGETDDSQVTNNTLSNAQFGVLFDVASTNNVVSGNQIYGNGQITSDTVSGCAVYTVDGSTNFQILNNHATGQRDAIALQQIGNGVSTGFLVQGNTVETSLNGVWMDVSNSVFTGNTFSGDTNGIDLTGTGNQITDNAFDNDSNCDVALTTSSSSDVNTLSDNTYDGSSTGGKFYNVGPGKVVGE